MADEFSHTIFHPTLERDDVPETRAILWRGWRMELGVDTEDATASVLAWSDRDDYAVGQSLPTVAIPLPWGDSPAKWAGIIMARLREDGA
jgi:hypothetical protein